MNSVSLIVVCVATVILGLQLNEAASLTTERELEATTLATLKYSNDGYKEYFEALKKLSGDLEDKLDKLGTILKSCKKIGHDLVVYNDLKKYVELMLMKLSAENTTLTEDNEADLQVKKKYTIFSDTDKRTWSSAKTACQDKGMELASIENEDEQQEMVKTVKSFGYDLDYVWIGGSDIEEEGKFTWSSSGRTLSYENWYYNNAGGPDENCLAIGGAEKSYMWADRNCGTLYNYVCEY